MTSARLAPIQMRTLPEITSDIAGLRKRREDALASVIAGPDAAASTDLRAVDAELEAFEAMCTRRRKHHLMSADLNYGDALVHWSAPGIAVHVRLSDLVELGAETMTIEEASRRACATSGRPCAIAGWRRPDGTAIGADLGIVHPYAHDDPVDHDDSGTDHESGSLVDPIEVAVAPKPADPATGRPPSAAAQSSLFGDDEPW